MGERNEPLGFNFHSLAPLVSLTLLPSISHPLLSFIPVEAILNLSVAILSCHVSASNYGDTNRHHEGNLGDASEGREGCV